MDTISSRESNTNILPMAGVIAGVLALILAIVALVKLGSVSKDINDLRGVSAKVDSLESQVAQLAQLGQAITDTKNYAISVANGTNTSFAKVGTEFTDIKGRLDRLESGHGGRVAHGGAGAAAAVAGPGEYIVKSGDIGATIARANGVTIAALMAVNPNVNWKRLHIGQRIRLPLNPQQAAAQQQAQQAAQPTQPAQPVQPADQGQLAQPAQ